MKKGFRFYIISALFIIAVGKCYSGSKPQQELIINKHHFFVQVATSNQDQVKGLSQRDDLKSNEGMLFIFDKAGKYPMWMKDTLIPLDMIFIDENNKIVALHPNAQPQDLTPINSPNAFKAVLEIKGNLCRSLGIKIGDKVIMDHLGH